MALGPGAVIAERYRLVGPLASGGMGTVWRARHLELDVDVALKLVTAELPRTPIAEKRFRREARAAARLRGPHIVQVFDYGTHEGHPYLAMELLEGEDLAARLARRGALDPALCLRVLEGVAKALAIAHGAGIVHRDLKPANVFLERVGGEEVVKVLDFGIAKDLRQAPAGDRTTANGVVGSPAYMSPEQVWGETVSTDADTWAMAVVAYECLTGENPFHHEVLAQVFDRIVKAKVPSPRDLIPALPEAVDAVFARALARAPAERFRSPADLLAALAIALGEKPTTADPNAETLAAPVAAATPTRRRARSMAALIAMGGLAVITVLAIRHRDTRSSQPAPTATSPPSTPIATRATAAPTVSPAAVVDPVVDAAPIPSAARVRAPTPRILPSSIHAASSAPTPTVDPKWGVPVPPP